MNGERRPVGIIRTLPWYGVPDAKHDGDEKTKALEGSALIWIFALIFFCSLLFPFFKKVDVLKCLNKMAFAGSVEVNHIHCQVVIPYRLIFAVNIPIDRTQDSPKSGIAEPQIVSKLVSDFYSGVIGHDSGTVGRQETHANIAVIIVRKVETVFGSVFSWPPEEIAMRGFQGFRYVYEELW